MLAFVWTLLTCVSLSNIVKGVAKIARQLGLDYAEAVVCTFPRRRVDNANVQKTRFDFKNRRAVPVIEGVVVAVENEDILLEVPSLQLLGFSASCTFTGVLGS